MTLQTYIDQLSTKLIYALGVVLIWVCLELHAIDAADQFSASHTGDVDPSWPGTGAAPLNAHAGRGPRQCSQPKAGDLL